MKVIVLATTNAHKVRELKSLLKSFLPEIDVRSLRDFPPFNQADETGSSFEKNALIKAQQTSSALKLFALADDSGLVVPALQGEPGIYSARYAGPSATDADNRKKLLIAMRGFEGLRRAAYFECALALSAPDGRYYTVRGSVEGEIILNERGRHGFGYDSLFIKHGYQKTFAELDEEIKNKISHRAKAIAKMKSILESMYSQEE